MGIAGIQIMKIMSERKKTASGKVSIDNNMTLADVTERTGGKKQGALSFSFSFGADYRDEEKKTIASINMDADVFYIDEPVRTKEILEGWKKNRTVDKNILRESMNTAMEKCNLAAILLTREMNLPSPIPLPKIKEE